jgi:dephospho-CoA kinase
VLRSPGGGAAIRVIGLTGGIGSGKSTVSEMLRALGAAVISSDALAREVVAPGQPALEEIREAFGPEVVQADGSLDRPALARRVFADPEARRRLEAITHPRVRALTLQRLDSLRSGGSAAAVVDVPLLYEVGMDEAGIFDEIWVVWVPAEVQVARVVARDRCDEAQARARLQAQWPLEEKARRADRVIDNSGDEEATRRQVEAAWTGRPTDAAGHRAPR